MTAVRKIQTANANGNSRRSHLKVVRGGMFPSTKKEKRIEQFWLFCHATLWNSQQFESTQIAEFKELITAHFKKFKDADQAFKQLVERVCLAKRYVTRRQGRYISKPVDWLDINYKNGLTGTESWYKSVVSQRKTVPHYNEGISTLARAVLNYCEKKNILEIFSFRKELIEQKQFDLMQIYMNTIMHVQFLNY